MDTTPSADAQARHAIHNFTSDTMTIHYVAGITEHTVNVLTGGMTIDDHTERLEPSNHGGKQWVTYLLAGGGAITLRYTAIVAIERRPGDSAIA